MQQQRQLRLGDILDDYCPRERRLTNHAVVAMVGPDVKQTRCTTCDAEHEYKHAKVPRQRKKSDAGGLYGQVLAGAPKRIGSGAAMGSAAAGAAPDTNDQLEQLGETGEQFQEPEGVDDAPAFAAASEAEVEVEAEVIETALDEGDEVDPAAAVGVIEEGPVHRPLIRATLPRAEGQPPPTRPAPDFTIRQPAGRPGRFRPRHQRGVQPSGGNRSNGNVAGSHRGARPNGGRPPHGAHGAMSARPARRQGGRKRSK
jgi:hypothetical protein